MEGQERDVARKKPQGRPRVGAPGDPLVPPLKIYLPAAVLERVDEVLAARKKARPGPGVLSRSEGIRDLLRLSLDAFGAGMGHTFEPMPRELLEHSHQVALRLSWSIFVEVEAFKDASASKLRVVAIQDLLWNGLRLWTSAQKRAAARRRVSGAPA